MTADMLYNILRAQIHAERFAVGSAMPSEAQLCAEYEAARGTVRAALQRLAEEGYLRAGQGRQRIVQRRQPLRVERLRVPGNAPTGRRSLSFAQQMRELGMEPQDIVLQSPMRQPCHALAREPRFDQGPAVSEELQIEPASDVIAFLRLRLANREPVCLQWTVIPAAILPEVPMDRLAPGGLSALYEQHHLVRHRLRASYAPSRASKLEADYLRLTAGAPLLEERRVSTWINPRTRAEEPYEYLLSLFTERVSLTFEGLDSRPSSQPQSPARKQAVSRG
jgi:GntR family transcriptional regulator